MERVIYRLSLYRQLLGQLADEGVENLFSHELAEMTGGTAAQVRRDLMALGYTGNSKKGYGVTDLAEAIGAFVDVPDSRNAVLVGVGNLGRSVLDHLATHGAYARVVAAFDVDSHMVDREIHGVWCYPMDMLEKVIREQNVRVGIITVSASEAQTVADTMIGAGVLGMLNFARIPLTVPPNVYLESVEFCASLETVAYFAGQEVRASIDGSAKPGNNETKRPDGTKK